MHKTQRQISRGFRLRLVFAASALLLCANDVAAPDWNELRRKPDAWFLTGEGLRITANVLSWQSENGTWPKNTDTTQRPNPGGADKVRGTFDNGATTDELRFLARAFYATTNAECREAVLRGIDGILMAQYPTGGWPQLYPPGNGYSRHITFNDGAMVRLLEFLREVASGESFRFVDEDRKTAAQAAVDRGVDCILKCQIVVDGKLTVWCAQHDEKDYQPRSARTYELVSLSGAESAGVLRFLMSLENPSPEIARAIKAGAEWFEAAKSEGIRAVRTNNDRVVVSDSAAPPLWARFYEMGSNRPIFSGRDGVKKYNLAEIERERRRGYAWYGNWGERVARDFARWRERWPQAAAARSTATVAAALRSSPIDRRALVERHSPSLRRFDPENPLSVGNGEFAFTTDITGLQTYSDYFTNTIPLGTLSHWGWHSFPNPGGWSIEKFKFNEFDVNGRKVGYADIPGNRRTPEINWLRGNPHRLHLGRIGFLLTRADGEAATPADLTDVEQRLELWTGSLRSRFHLDGERVEVETICHPTTDALAVRVKSPLMKTGRVKIELRFPYGTGASIAADWTRPDAHQTEFNQPRNGEARFVRRLDDDCYHVAATWKKAELTQAGSHHFVLTPLTNVDTVEFVCAFSAEASSGRPPSFGQTRTASRAHWEEFWQSGGAIDLSGSRDARWRELERRMVLSQYLTAIQCAGSSPPQETGLTYNSWEGKFHLEMHWWHATHFALWNRLPLLEKSLGYYEAILPRAQATARRQGYAGARWPKMTDPSGAESPSSVGPFLIWQQPHPIFYAELVYRKRGDRKTLEQFKEIVSESAEFMASYAEWDEATKRYVLGPALQCAQEIFPKHATLNPTYELTYWRWGLETAQRWRERLDLPRVEKWDRVLASLAKPPVAEGKYLFTETAADTYSNKKWVDDHPSVTAAVGILPGPGVDRETMRRTLDWIWDNWNWPDTWGWDYPMVAMCAARVGEPERAVDALLLDTPKNRYRLNGHNHQRPGLTIYLPGNGGLLYAVAMMAAGWDGAPNQHAPGFPDNGQWVVKWENLRPAP